MKQTTLKVVKKTFLEKVDTNEYFRKKLIKLLNQDEVLILGEKR